MANNPENPDKGANKPGEPAPKKPSAILDLKPSGVEVNDIKSDQPKAEPPKADPAKAGEPKSAAAGPGQSGPEAAKASPGKPEVKPEPAGAATRKPADQMPKPQGALTPLLTHLAAGLAGGMIALVGADTLISQMGGFGPGSEDLERRLRAVEQTARAPQVPNAISDRLAAAEQKLSNLDDVARQIQTLAARPAGQAETELGGRLTKVEETLAALSSGAGDNRRGPQNASLAGRVADLEQAMGTQIAQLRKSVAQDIDSRLGPIADGTDAAKAGTQRLDRDLSLVKADAAKASQRLDAMKVTDDKLQEDANALRTQIDTLKSQIAEQIRGLAKPQDIAATVGPVQARVSALESSVQGVIKSENERRANADRIVLALELGNLKRAVDRGGGYERELDQVSRLSQGRLNLTVLGQYRSEGVPTLSALTTEFRGLINPILDADATTPEAGVVDRLLASAKSIVRVRRVTQGADDQTAEAIVARMEAALKDGRLGDVQAEAKKLPPKAQAPAQVWLTKVAARVSVDQAISEIEDKLKASLTAAQPEQKG
jgi:hypothetical protein